MTGHDDEWKLQHCPALVTLKLISGKWKTRILWLLRSGPMTFGTLRRRLESVSAKMLTDHLRQLEADGLVYRKIEMTGGVQTSHYGFTGYGKTLVPVLDALGSWGLNHEDRDRTSP